MRLRLLALVLLLALSTPGSFQAQTSAPAVEAWAMLIQMMSRLRAEIARGDLSAVHFEDPVPNGAVAGLLQPTLA